MAVEPTSGGPTSGRPTPAEDGDPSLLGKGRRFVRPPRSYSPFLNREGGRGVRFFLLLLCLFVRLIALDADPPPWLSWSGGLYTDEGFYTLDARHEALFGTAAPGNFHDRLLSPLLSVLQQGVFSLFGAGPVQARLLPVLFSLLTLGALWLGLRRAFGPRAADLGALFLGLAPPYVLYNRLALQETPAAFWLTLGFALWVYGARRPALYVLAGLSIAAASVFKGLALLGGAGLLGGPPAPNNGGVRGGKPSVPNLAPPLLGAGGAILGLLLYAALWYGPHHAELARMAAYYRVHQMQPHSWLSVGLNVRRGLIGGERGVLPLLLATLPLPCLLVGWGVARQEGGAAGRFLTLWLAAGLLFCLLSSYAPSRYYVLFLPALAGLAAQSLAKRRPSVQAAAVMLFVVVSGGWLGAAWTGRSYAERDAGRTLARTLPPGSVVIGEFAPTLCLGTPFAAAPSQPGLSNDVLPVERLGATHILVTRTVFWQNWWQTRYPDAVQPSHRVAVFTLGGRRKFVVDVYAVKEAR